MKDLSDMPWRTRMYFEEDSLDGHRKLRDYGLNAYVILLHDAESRGRVRMEHGVYAVGFMGRRLTGDALVTRIASWLFENYQVNLPHDEVAKQLRLVALEHAAWEAGVPRDSFDSYDQAAASRTAVQALRDLSPHDRDLVLGWFCRECHQPLPEPLAKCLVCGHKP